MPALPILRHPDRYRPCIQDLLEDAEGREYWIRLFENHRDTLATLPIGDQFLSDQANWNRFLETYLEGLKEMRRHPEHLEELNVLALTKFRDGLLRSHGFADPFLDLKTRENRHALGELPSLLADLDQTADTELVEKLVRGMFAGNLFDMGSRDAVDAFANQKPGFAAARNRVRARPWPIDDLDAFELRFRERRYSKALIFVDNAGPDITLGVIPFARSLLSSDTEVVLAANGAPSLNDITVVELRGLLDQISRFDRTIAEAVQSNRLRVVESGCTSPLINLRDLTNACCNEAEDADLLMIEGMGRAIESNFDAAFTIDTIKIALIKDRMVASLVGVELFDPVFRFEPA